MTDANGNRITIAERQIGFLERAETACMKCMAPRLVTQMGLHCRDAVNAAEEGKDMVYGK
ncbi:hypothetical protein PI125_g23535 [Phytophthora idaei]|nr:hypothetical protein PI125_g23535 [Phytophthora idaei]